MGASERGHVVGGALDVCIGVPDLVEAVAYWELFGYRVGDVGKLDSAGATALYGQPGGLSAVRMWHQDADHGLVRLWQWERPSGPGLGMAPFRVHGSRWTAMELDRVARMVAHAKYHKAQGGDIRMFHPDVLPAPGVTMSPFRRELPVAMEMAVLQPLYRQVLFERADFPSPLYGAVNHHCLLRSSQFTHLCVITCGVSADAFDFYDRVLGLQRSGDFRLSWGDVGSSGKDIFELREGEGFHMFRFDDPRSEGGISKRSGRVILFNFAAESALEDMRGASRPGALGYTLYSLRVADVEAAHAAVRAGGASMHSGIEKNEFGETSFVAAAPDGTPWCFVAADDTLALAA
jgi:uncharacterized glyoxalase superfamily protein PhnB